MLIHRLYDDLNALIIPMNRSDNSGLGLKNEGEILCKNIKWHVILTKTTKNDY